MTDASTLIDRSGVHHEWREILQNALSELQPDYVESLLHDGNWLPGSDRLLAAFRRDRAAVRYLLIGESPYPRAESANGIAFYDAAVGELWSDRGLSKAVNRATSLRNIVKTALLAEGHLQRDADGKITQDAIARLDKRPLIKTLPELFVDDRSYGLMQSGINAVQYVAGQLRLEPGTHRLRIVVRADAEHRDEYTIEIVPSEEIASR